MGHYASANDAKLLLALRCRKAVLIGVIGDSDTSTSAAGTAETAAGGGGGRVGGCRSAAHLLRLRTNVLRGHLLLIDLE